MVTPFLKSLNTDGGTLYVFPSASKDLTRTFVSSDYEFVFSHFACLNLPNIVSGTYDSEEGQKGLYLETFGYTVPSWSTGGMGQAIAEHLQNYVMNFETAILNGEGDNDDYDNDILTSVSEKVFFNWLQKVGGIKFNDNTEYYQSFYNRTVQYIGNIDVVNTVEFNGDSFDELYIHIPSSVGASTSVYFRNGELTDNKNYLDKDYYLSRDSESCIIGRSDTTHPYGLSKNPIMDDDNGSNLYRGDIGHTIDFRDSSYADGDGISTMNSNSSEDFEFNAILIYYDLYEKTSTKNVKKVATNLYGILFIDNVTDDVYKDNSTDNTNGVHEQGYFQRYPKKKETVLGNGNSFALKVDLKVDTIPDATSTVEKYKDPNDVISMSLYEKALIQLQKCIDIFYQQNNEIVRLQERVSSLETMVMGIDTVETLRGEINRLYNLYDGSGLTDSANLLSLIEINSNKLNSIMNGEKNVKLQYDTDVIQPGFGVDIDKSMNKVVINSDQKYSINTLYSDLNKEHPITKDTPVDTTSTESKHYYFTLRTGENFVILYVNNTGECKSDIVLSVDESDVDFKIGQAFNIYIDAPDGIDFIEGSVYGLVINIGATDIKILGDELVGKNRIEVICVNEDEYIYLIK